MRCEKRAMCQLMSSFKKITCILNTAPPPVPAQYYFIMSVGAGWSGILKTFLSRLWFLGKSKEILLQAKVKDWLTNHLSHLPFSPWAWVVSNINTTWPLPPLAPSRPHSYLPLSETDVFFRWKSGGRGERKQQWLYYFVASSFLHPWSREVTLTY